jgi:hypothetical protein
MIILSLGWYDRARDEGLAGRSLVMSFAKYFCCILTVARKSNIMYKIKYENVDTPITQRSSLALC